MENHLAIGVLAIAATILIRYKVYTPDSNLLVVGVTFLLVYGLLWGLAAAVRKLRASRCKRAEDADAAASRPDVESSRPDLAD